MVFLPDGRRPAVVGILPRHGVLARRDPADRASEQILATNLDHVFILVPLDRETSLAWIERSLVLVHESGADPAVILSKADLNDRPPCVRDRGPRRSPETTPSTSSAPSRARESTTLRPYFDGNATVAMFGASGAGKSTLVNALIGERAAGDRRRAQR